MKSNFLVIIFSGFSISLMGVLLLILPEYAKQMIEKNMEFFLTIPPIAVASYILVFKYLEKYQNEVPTIGEMTSKIFQGALIAFGLFFLMAIITGILFRLYIIYFK